MVHNMKLQPEPFNKIQNGQKTIELRLLDEKRQLVNVGDIIEFVNMKDETQKIVTEVIALHKFENFKQLYKSLPLEKCGYEKNEIANADPKDMELFYSSDKQKKYGVVGIELKLL